MISLVPLVALAVHLASFAGAQDTSSPLAETGSSPPGDGPMSPLDIASGVLGMLGLGGSEPGSASGGFGGLGGIGAPLGSGKSHGGAASAATPPSLSDMFHVSMPRPDTSAYSQEQPAPRWGAAAAYLPTADAVVFAGGQTSSEGTLTNETLLLDMSALNDMSKTYIASRQTPWLRVRQSNASEALPPLAYAASSASSRMCSAGSSDTFWLIGGKTQDCSEHTPAMFTWSVESRNNSYYGSWAPVNGTGNRPHRRAHARAMFPPQGLAGNKAQSLLVHGGQDWDAQCHQRKADANTTSPTMDVWSLPEPYLAQCGLPDRVSLGSLHLNATRQELQLRRRLHSVPAVDYALVPLPSRAGAYATHGANASAVPWSQPVGFFGGRDTRGNLASFQKPWVIDMASGQWDRLATTGDAPSPRVGHSALHTTDGRVLVYGGYTQKNGTSVRRNPTSEMHLLDMTQRPARWSRVRYPSPPKNGTRPSARAYHSAVMVDDVMVVGFGQEHQSTAYGLQRRGGSKQNGSDPLVMYLDTRPTAMEFRWTDKLSAVVAARVTKDFLGVPEQPDGSDRADTVLAGTGGHGPFVAGAANAPGAKDAAAVHDGGMSYADMAPASTHGGGQTSSSPHGSGHASSTRGSAKSTATHSSAGSKSGTGAGASAHHNSDASGGHDAKHGGKHTAEGTAGGASAHSSGAPGGHDADSASAHGDSGGAKDKAGGKSDAGTGDTGDASGASPDGGASDAAPGDSDSPANDPSSTPASSASGTSSPDAQHPSHSSGASNVDSPTNGDSESTTSKSSGAIAGGVLGAAALAVGAVVGGLYAYKKRKESQKIASLRSSGVFMAHNRRPDDPEMASAPPVSSLWLSQPRKEPMYGGPSNASAHMGQSHPSTFLPAAHAGGRSMTTDERIGVRGPRGVPLSLAAGSGGALAAGAAGAYAADYATPEHGLDAYSNYADGGSTHADAGSTGSHYSYPYLNGTQRPGNSDVDMHSDDMQDGMTADSSSIDTHHSAGSMYSNSVNGMTMYHHDGLDGGCDGPGLSSAASFRFPETKTSPKTMSYPYPDRRDGHDDARFDSVDSNQSTLRVTN
ncbi:hypothetical protein MSPP1_002586 [Malassezia sp. CBS 17886]|nr:hypothetical protein MSPP1_002586 [Malassezia sp. CBS 17886]